MTMDRRTKLDLVLIPVGLFAFALLVWFSVYAGPDRADKIEAELQTQAEAVLSDKNYAWAQVEVFGQKAVITGEAPTEELRRRAIQKVLASTGRGGSFWGGISSVDDQVTVQPIPDLYRFAAEIDDSIVTLSGYLPSLDGFDRLKDTILSAGYSEDQINDQSQFADGAPQGDWLGAAELGVTQLIRLHSGIMTLEGTRIQLDGRVETNALHSDILTKLIRPPTGYSADANLLGLSVWEVRLNDQGLRYSGAVPDAADRTDLIKVTERFYSAPVQNEMVIKPMDQTAWVLGVRAALPKFLEFHEGRIALLDNELTIEGRATESVLEFLREDVVQVGALVNIRFNVDTSPPELQSLAGLDDAEPLSADQCKAGIEEAQGLGDLEFSRRGVKIERASGPALDAMAGVIKRCADFTFAIDAFTVVDGRRMAGKLITEERQRAISDYFIVRGVPLDQIELTAVDVGFPSDFGDLKTISNRQIYVRLRE